ncbi:MAG TPA: phosphoribosyl-AMP cyclohydrolase [Ktedonobacteraceae bacterium]|jgi:phosphoribosyl-AMP cyclohydrolase|nr:phosphoribosyl-AMP cyclohydrolase [Ktedonobacteraceae bacterium]
MLKFDREGLLPAIIVDDATGEVLMLAFMNERAFQLTRETGFTHFYSRSRQKLWRKGEESGHTQEVRGIYVNCEENSLLIRVVQHGDAACHTGYRSCYYRQLLPDNGYEIIAERVFDPEKVYYSSGDTVPVGMQFIASTNTELTPNESTSQAGRDSSRPYNDVPTPQAGRDESRPYTSIEQFEAPLETMMRQLYGVYLYLRDHDLSEESNTSRLLQERSPAYLAARLADELQELADVQNGTHVHSDRQFDTALEGSQVGYWLMLLAAIYSLKYADFHPHVSLLQGFAEHYSMEKSIEQREECLQLVTTYDPSRIPQGLAIGFALIGWACAEAGISPLAPAEYDLEQMRRKGLVK